MTDVRSFLGLACYCRRFIKNFSKITTSLTNPTRKNTLLFWDGKCQATFVQLKEYLTLTPVLLIPNADEMFIVFIDALLLGLGGVLIQKNQMIAYVARKLMVHERNYHIYDLELTAVVFVLKL